MWRCISYMYTAKGKKSQLLLFFFAISENERGAIRKLAPLPGEENIIILGRVKWVVPFPKNTSTYGAVLIFFAHVRKACFKRRATAVLSWLDCSSTAGRH